MSPVHFIKSVANSSLAAMLTLTVLFATFLVLEPTVGRSATDTFEVTQTITDETSFVLSANDVTMSPQNIAGLTGGRASGTTTVRVRTNNATGFNMTIAFSSTTAMTRDGGGGTIRNYNPATINVPDYTFGSEVYGQFAYTVIASTSNDLDTSFRDNGAGACAASTGNLASTCWLNPSTTAKQVILTSAASQTSGSTTTIAFRVDVPSNPVPSIPEGVYTATATLTATNN